MANQLRYSKGEKFGIIAAKVTRKHGKYYDRRRWIVQRGAQSRGLSFVNNGPIRK